MDVEIILPSTQNKVTNKPRNKILKENSNRQKNGESLIEKEFQNLQPELEPYLHENTKYYLNTVVQEIAPLVTQQQLIEIVKIICNTFNCVECIKKERKGNKENRNKFLLTEFINTKTAEACSKKTLTYYRTTIQRFIEYTDKHFDDVTTEDCEKYFMHGVTKEKNPWTPTTQDNIRRILNSFYSWAVGRRYVLFNPLTPIKPTKNKKYRVKKPFTNTDIIKMRDNTKTVRDRAIIELLLSSGIRVAELVGLNKEDINWSEKEFTVIGKGNKQRFAYFSEQAGFYIQKYLQGRTDNNPALFVTRRNKQWQRLGINGVETMVRLLGQRSKITGRAHPHRFRHTFATNALNKGVPLEQVQQLLGHEQLDTTLIYAKVAREDVKYNHKKLMN